MAHLKGPSMSTLVTLLECVLHGRVAHHPTQWTVSTCCQPVARRCNRSIMSSTTMKTQQDSRGSVVNLCIRRRPSVKFLSPLLLVGELGMEPIPTVFQPRRGCTRGTLVKSPVCHRATNRDRQPFAFTFTHLPKTQSSDCERKLQYQDKMLADTVRTCKLRTEKLRVGIKHTAFL